MEVVVVDVVMVDVDVVLDVVVGDGEIFVPENQRVILVAVKGFRNFIIPATIGKLMLVNLPGSVVPGVIVVAAATLVVIATM